jgi:hypothetical protein
MISEPAQKAEEVKASLLGLKTVPVHTVPPRPPWPTS